MPDARYAFECQRRMGFIVGRIQRHVANRREMIESQQAEENERIQDQDSGSVRHAKLRAEKARLAEEDSVRKQERALAKQKKEQAIVEVPESKEIEEQSYDNHEWLVE